MKTNSVWSTIFGRAALAALLAIGCGVASAQPIYRENPRSATPGIDQHQQRQQQRIYNGVRRGELTGHEARRLEQQQRRIRHMERRARADGVVTRQERHQIQAAQRQASRSIRNQRQDSRRY